MINPDQAWAIIASSVTPLPNIRLPLSASAGCVLAEDVHADRDLPPADRSAMDGYAVRCSDLQAAGKPSHPACFLKLVGEVAAGSSARPQITSGTCARILTGANIPPGADSVVMVENTIEDGTQVEIRSVVKLGANILRRAEDARKGKILLCKGDMLDEARVGVCAAVGRAELEVFRRPRIIVLCTGAELKAPEDAVLPYQVRNSNGPALCAALTLRGFAPATYQTLPDQVDHLTAAVRQAGTQYDVILLAGGMSVGKYDLVRQAIEQVGATVRLHGVSMKPGKPFLFATLPARSGCATDAADNPGNRAIFGLPGNPLSALTGFHEFVLPALRLMSGVDPKACRPTMRLPLESELTSKGGRTHYVLGRLNHEATVSCVVPVASQSSADLVSGGQADGVIVVPGNITRLKAGEIVEFRPWSALSC